MNPWRHLFAFILASCFLYGCATPAPRTPYVLGSSGGRVVHGGGDGVEVSAELVTNPQTLKDYFGLHSPSLGVLTVFVKAENSGRADSILVEKDEMQLLAGSISQGETGDPLKNRGTILNSGEFAANVVIAGVLPAFIAAARQKAATDYNYMKWEFRTTTLEPAQAVGGFVYFGGNAAALPPGCHLLVPVHNLSNQTTNAVQLPLQP